MSDDLPGFIDDEPKPKKREPAAPAKGFNAFADVDVDAPSPAKPSAAPITPARAEAKTAPGFDAFADGGSASAAAQAEVDNDIKPGQGKDLWACPHCGAKNKPDRTTCRSCGKSPQDEVIVPFMQTPAGRFGVPAGVVLVLVLLGWFLFGGSVDLVPADPGNIDSAVRTGGSTGGETQEGGMIFQPRVRTAVCGRVVAVDSKAGVVAVVLALGGDGKDADAVAGAKVDFAATPPTVSPDLRHAVIYCLGRVPERMTPGEVLSLVGDGGLLIRDGRIADDFAGGTVLRIERSAP